VIIYPPAIAGGTDCIQDRFLTFEAKLRYGATTRLVVTEGQFSTSKIADMYNEFLYLKVHANGESDPANPTYA
jgi:hypothetical protein